jgi:hypothetical protein
MNASSVFLLLPVLACPLMMMWMMRGGHGHGRHAHSGHHDESHASPMRERSTTCLRDLRDEIDQLIEEREQVEREQPERGPRVSSLR